MANKPIYEKNWLDKFKPVNQLVVKNATTIRVPQGSGFMYVSQGAAQLLTDEKFTLNDLP